VSGSPAITLSGADLVPVSTPRDEPQLSVCQALLSAPDRLQAFRAPANPIPAIGSKPSRRYPEPSAQSPRATLTGSIVSPGLEITPIALGRDEPLARIAAEAA